MLKLRILTKKLDSSNRDTSAVKSLILSSGPRIEGGERNYAIKSSLTQQKRRKKRSRRAIILSLIFVAPKEEVEVNKS